MKSGLGLHRMDGKTTADVVITAGYPADRTGISGGLRPFFRGIGLSVVLVGLSGSSVLACPMCAETAAADPLLPQAYMTSILFMLAVPFAMFGLFGLWIGRAIRRQDAARWQAYAATRDKAVAKQCPVLTDALAQESDLSTLDGSLRKSMTATLPTDSSSLGSGELVPAINSLPGRAQLRVPNRGADLIVLGEGQTEGLCVDLSAPRTHVVTG